MTIHGADRELSTKIQQKQPKIFSRQRSGIDFSGQGDNLILTQQTMLFNYWRQNWRHTPEGRKEIGDIHWFQSSTEKDLHPSEIQMYANVQMQNYKKLSQSKYLWIKLYLVHLLQFLFTSLPASIFLFFTFLAKYAWCMFLFQEFICSVFQFQVTQIPSAFLKKITTLVSFYHWLKPRGA